MLADAGKRLTRGQAFTAERKRQQRDLGLFSGLGNERGEPAAAVEMRIIEQLLRSDDRRIGEPARLEPILQLAHGIFAKNLLQPCNEPFARQDALIVGGDARIVRELLQLEYLTENLPLRVADDAEKDLLAACTLEHVVDAPGRDARRHRLRRLAG